MPSFQLDELATHLNAECYGDGKLVITSIASMSKAVAGQITFLAEKKYQSKLEHCQASVVVLTEESRSFWSGAALVVKNPYLAYAKLAQLFDTTPLPADQISLSAVISPDAVIGSHVSIGANAVIESGVVLGDHCVIGAGCFVGKNARIGSKTKLWANVTIYHGCELGERCLVQSGSIIGSDGFGYANDKGRWIKIPQLGRVIIGNDVEIGACTTIDRGALDDTVISNGVIIDNQCQIAHNVTIDEHTAVAGGVIMAGSLKVGRHCMIGGASVLNGHMEICDQVTITGMSMVIRSVSKPGVYSSGIPAQENKAWRKMASLVLHIDEMHSRLKALEKKLLKFST